MVVSEGAGQGVSNQEPGEARQRATMENRACVNPARRSKQ